MIQPLGCGSVARSLFPEAQVWKGNSVSWSSAGFHPQPWATGAASLGAGRVGVCPALHLRAPFHPIRVLLPWPLSLCCGAPPSSGPPAAWPGPEVVLDSRAPASSDPDPSSSLAGSSVCRLSSRPLPRPSGRFPERLASPCGPRCPWARKRQAGPPGGPASAEPAPSRRTEATSWAGSGRWRRPLTPPQTCARAPPTAALVGWSVLVTGEDAEA